MNSRHYIMVFTFLVLFAVHANAQFSSGSVIMHSDPRLAVLLKKNPVAAPPPTHVPGTDGPSKKKNNTKANGKETPMASASPVASGTPEAPAAPVNPPVPKSEVKVHEPVSTPHAAGKPRYVVAPVHKDGPVIYTGKGFRVQIYNGYDRDKAVTVRTEFMSRYPGTRTYLSYAAPYFKVRVGDYRNRNDAKGMLSEANDLYSTPCMIVPDQITIHAN